jgi:hypothetical protein
LRLGRAGDLPAVQLLPQMLTPPYRPYSPRTRHFVLGFQITRTLKNEQEAETLSKKDGFARRCWGKQTHEKITVSFMACVIILNSGRVFPPWTVR